ncbi:MAG TPA: 5-formyltetrahydrofolate cyclo-ligase [Chitinophagaceae bacterium]|nr:5-formyltetrahydrofolate cyclo-ligase [Chitinophagaceae bacterium]
MTKAELRKIYKQKRKDIPAKDKLKLDDLLLIQFQQMYFPQVSLLLTYWPLDRHIEPNTHLFSGYLRHTIPGLGIAYPVMDMATGTFKPVLVKEETTYVTNSYGITEPKEGQVIDAMDIDLVLVPMLACDIEGYRVGYGKGFYDRFLTACRGDVITVGFSYFEPVDKIDDTQSFDVPLNYCVTTEAVYEF